MILCSEHFTYRIVTHRRRCIKSTKIIAGTMAQRGTSGTINIVKIIYLLQYSGQNRLEEGYKMN